MFSQQCSIPSRKEKQNLGTVLIPTEAIITNGNYLDFYTVKSKQYSKFETLVALVRIYGKPKVVSFNLVWKMQVKLSVVHPEGKLL